MPAEIYLATVAIEPTRWSWWGDGAAPETVVSDWLDPIARAGFDGLELWERHATQVAPAELDALLAGPMPLRILSAYPSWDDPDDAQRTEVARWARRLGVRAVKFNVGSEPDQVGAYIERLARWHEVMDDDIVLLCECHVGTVTDDHGTAAALFDAVAGPDRLQALVHTHHDLDDLQARFDHYGERITHVHVNHLDLGAPPLATIVDVLDERIDLFARNGFAGTWSIEFVDGVGGDHDDPEHTVAAAAADLAVLTDRLAAHGATA